VTIFPLSRKWQLNVEWTWLLDAGFTSFFRGGGLGEFEWVGVGDFPHDPVEMKVGDLRKWRDWPAALPLGAVERCELQNVLPFTTPYSA